MGNEIDCKRGPDRQRTEVMLGCGKNKIRATLDIFLTMKRPKPIRPERVRAIRGSFSWVDHDFINRGIIDVLTKEEIVLYYFLVSVGDNRGMSFYRREKICSKLKLGINQYERAKQSLLKYDLIAYKPFNRHSLSGYFQVLSLPETNRGMEI